MAPGRPLSCIAPPVTLALGIPSSSPTFVLFNPGKTKLAVALGLGDVSIDNDDPPAHLRHQIDELARLIQVIKEATAEYRIEDTILRQVLDIITRESQVGQIGPRFDSLTILKIALSNLDAQRIKSGAREFEGIATLEAPKIDNPFAGDAIRKEYPQELLGELKQREMFHLPGLLRLGQRAVVKPDVVRRKAARHDLPLPQLTYHFSSAPLLPGPA